MQQLHLVGYTTDRDGLIFSARKGSKSGGFLVVLDHDMRSSIEAALRSRDSEAGAGDESDSGPPRRRRSDPRPVSALTPREMQARLRAGRSITAVARDAGVDEEWVSRWAVPIIAEQAQVVSRAQALTFSKPRRGASAHPLGTSVQWALADKGVRMREDEFAGAWSAWNLRASTWVVRFTYVSRKRAQEAEWELDLRKGELIAWNRLATELAYVEPGRKRRPPPPLAPAPPTIPAPPGTISAVPVPIPPTMSATPKAGPESDGRSGNRKALAKKATTNDEAAAQKRPAKRGRPPATKKAAGKAATKRTARKKVVATPAKRRSAPKRSTTKRTPVKRSPATRATTKRSTAKRSARRRAVTPRVARTRRATAKRVAPKRTTRKRAATRGPASKRPAAKRRGTPRRVMATRRTAAKRRTASPRASATRRRTVVGKKAGSRPAKRPRASASAVTFAVPGSGPASDTGGQPARPLRLRGLAGTAVDLTAPPTALRGRAPGLERTAVWATGGNEPPPPLTIRADVAAAASQPRRPGPDGSARRRARPLRAR